MVTAPPARGRTLRNAITEPEVWLWARLKRLRERPFKGYDLDFVCIDRRLVIELDGSQHAYPLQAEHDGVRGAVLARAGYRVLRFWNSDVRTNIGGVMHMIVLALEEHASVKGKEGLGD